MLTVFAILILIAGFIVFFLDEISRLWKKIFLIPGMKILLPLFAASFLIEASGEWSLWLLLRIMTLTNQLIVSLASFFPNYSYANTLFHIILLSLIGVLPIWIAKLKPKASNYHYLHLQTDYVVLLVWTVLAVLMTVI